MTNKETMSDFEQSLANLEQIVSKMEQGQLSLEESLEAFEQGVALTKKCQTTLKNAEQRVAVLLEQNSDLKTKEFNENLSE